jgi:hypothetical protein
MIRRTDMPSTGQFDGAPDDILTICAIAVIASVCANVIHEGLGHAATALATVAHSGVLSTVAWSGNGDSRLVAAAGTLANLVAGGIVWLALRSKSSASTSERYFLFLCATFNLLAGTGYFFFSGVSNFGDWADVIAGTQSHAMWRVLLAVGGIALYFAAVLAIGRMLVAHVGIPRGDSARMHRLLYVPYFAAVTLQVFAATFNPMGIQLMWESALPGTAGADNALLWLQYYIPRRLECPRPAQPIVRSYAWIGAAAAVAVIFVFVLGRGISLHR